MWSVMPPADTILRKGGEEERGKEDRGRQDGREGGEMEGGRLGGGGGGGGDEREMEGGRMGGRGHTVKGKTRQVSSTLTTLVLRPPP